MLEARKNGRSHAAKTSDNPPKPPAEATAMLFPLETSAELINVAVGGLKVPMGHDGLILRMFAPGRWVRTRMRGRVAVEKNPKSCNSHPLWLIATEISSSGGGAAARR